MSTSIYQGPKILVSAVANTCDRCEARGRVVEFFVLSPGALCHLCFSCLYLITDAAHRGAELTE